MIAKARELAWLLDVRLDAGLTQGGVLDDLTEASVRFVGRLKSNPRLEAMAKPYLQRPAGRPPKEGYQEVIELGWHRAESWRHAQRLLLVVIDQPNPRTGQLNLMPHCFFLVTNWTHQEKSGWQVLEHYRQRGTFEERLGEFRAAVGVHLSSPQFCENETLLLLALLAYNLQWLLRTELETEEGGCWDLKRFQQSVLKAGGRFTKHSRQLVLYLASAVALFWRVLDQCLARWRLADRWKPRGPTRRRWKPPPRHAHLGLVLRH